MNGQYFNVLAINQKHGRGKFCVHVFSKGWIEHYYPAPDMNPSTKENKVLYPATQHLRRSKSNSEENQVL